MNLQTHIKALKIKRLKQNMTLLEVLIAMALLSLLLVIVFGFFRELFWLNEYTKNTIKQSFEKRYVESRLSYLFSHIINENASGKQFYFFITKDEASSLPSLVLTFENGDIADNLFGGDVLGRLFVDQAKHLCLAIWPLEMGKDKASEDMRAYIKMEYLLNQVEDLQFHCFAAPDTQNQGGEPAEPQPGKWLTNEWDKEYGEMPVIIKIDVTFSPDSKKETFAFVLPSSKHPVTFLPKK